METILVIEDSRVAQTQLKDILEVRYRLVIREDGPTGMATAFASPPDLILLDINLPGLNGLEICRLLKPDRRTAEVPIIFVTSQDAGRERVQGFQAGADDYIVKPFYPGELLARIRLHLSSRREKQAAVELERMRGMSVTISREIECAMTTIHTLIQLAGDELPEKEEGVKKHLTTATHELNKITEIVSKLAAASLPAPVGHG